MFQLQGLTAMQHSSMVDECYLVIGAHIDAVTQDKIQRGEYVDFTHLLPRDRMQYDDGWLEIVHKGDKHSLYQLQSGKLHQWERLQASTSGSKLSEFTPIFTPEHTQPGQLS